MGIKLAEKVMNYFGVLITQYGSVKAESVINPSFVALGKVK
jgi:hypothetical protein